VQAKLCTDYLDGLFKATKDPLAASRSLQQHSMEVSWLPEPRCMATFPTLHGAEIRYIRDRGLGNWDLSNTEVDHDYQSDKPIWYPSGISRSCWTAPVATSDIDSESVFSARLADCIDARGDLLFSEPHTIQPSTRAARWPLGPLIRAWSSTNRV
jgi:hypothetical protein